MRLFGSRNKDTKLYICNLELYIVLLTLSVLCLYFLNHTFFNSLPGQNS